MSRYIMNAIGLSMLWILLSYCLGWNATETINISFLIGLTAMVLFVLIKINHSGFLSVFLSGFKKMKHFLFVRSNAMARVEDQAQQDQDLKVFKSRMHRMILAVTFNISLSSLFISFAGLILYYTA